MISGNSRVCGIMANPVGHSLSPLMHNFYAEKTGIDLVYIPLKVEEEYLEAAVRGAYALNFLGMNVTVPYKQAVMKYLVEIDEDAKAIGAVNTLVRVEGGFKGYNTDAAGLRRVMTEAEIAVEGRDCVIIGAGGAARAATYVLARDGARTIRLLNRSAERAERLAEITNRQFDRKIVIPMALEDYRSLPGGASSYVVIQTTSVGMVPNVDSVPIEDEVFYGRIEAAVDVVYTPVETVFMKKVAAAGGRAVGGLDMLIYQGVIAYELWNPGAVFAPDCLEQARALLRQQLEAER